MHADEVLTPWFTSLTALLGDEVTLFDAHTHVGANDPDGMACSVEDLDAALSLANARGVVFPMHEPDGYRGANDALLAAARDSDGRLTAFARIDPRAGGLAEAQRALDAGACGIKLHPRAERFSLHEPEVESLFALAHERHIPVLCHAGRGIPALGQDALALTARYPDAQLILAHAAICDLAWIWAEAGSHPNLLFDTAWWSASDLLTLFSLVPPGQILFASDAPYGTPVQAMILTARCALQAGLDATQLRWVMGAQLERLLGGESPRDLGPAPGDHAPPGDLLLDRVNTFLVTAIGRAMVGGDVTEALALARLACDVPAGTPQAPACEAVRALLDAHDAHFASYAAHEGAPRFPGLHVLVVASAVARTPDVGGLPAG